MKLPTLSLVVVASMALAQMRAVESVPLVPPMSKEHQRRTLIGDETTYSNVADNSRGKQFYGVDHNGDSSVHKRLDGVERRSLLDELLGGVLDRTSITSIENENDNSQATQAMNSHGNRHTTIKKIQEWTRGGSRRRGKGGHSGETMHADKFFDRRGLEDKDVKTEPTSLERRSLLGDLLGDDSTRIENSNDNSQHKQTFNSHGNKHTSITKLHQESEDDDYEISPEEFFDRRELVEDQEIGYQKSDRARLYRRGLLWGDKNTMISNVNDNSKTIKTFNSHHNKDIHISKAKYDKRAEMEETGREDLERRGLLFGGDSMTISNQNDNSRTTTTYNSHGNKHKKIFKGKSHRRHRCKDDDESWFKKREDKYDDDKNGQIMRRGLYDLDKSNTGTKHDLPETMTTTTTLLQFDEAKKKVEDLGRRNLVSIQIVTQNSNGQNIDNNVFAVNRDRPKTKRPHGHHRRPKNRTHSAQTPHKDHSKNDRNKHPKMTKDKHHG
ncbi:hypothetical protein BGX28_000998 [Mortierella sp. GBA30]|nr:hypothetical protein BGX28_000998 [Mortierella sp. GBA30]